MARVQIPLIYYISKALTQHSYAEGMKFDPETTWIELVLGSDEAIARCKSFMKAYVQASVKQRVVLGPEEVVMVPTIGAGTTLEDLWAALVKVADMKVMAPKRRENPRDAGFWTLTYNSQSKGSTEKTPYKIARVSIQDYGHV